VRCIVSPRPIGASEAFTVNHETKASDPEARASAEETVADGVCDVRASLAFLGNWSRASLYREIYAGNLPIVKLGRRTYIPKRSLVALLAAGLRGGRRPD
jgi:hypothetical protein